MSAKGKTFLMAAFLVVVTAMIATVLFSGLEPATAPSAINATAQPSVDAAGRAARRILASVERPTHVGSALSVAQALDAANQALGDRVFMGSRTDQGQLLAVTVQDRRWASLSDPDRNALFAALASSWAAIWQWNNPHGALKNGPIVRVRDQHGHTLREGLYQRQG